MQTTAQFRNRYHTCQINTLAWGILNGRNSTSLQNSANYAYKFIDAFRINHSLSLHIKHLVIEQ